MAVEVRLSYRQPAPRGAGAFALDVDARLPGQGITAVVGPSGGGKTTLLRCMAGLEAGASGQLCVNGQVWQSDSLRLPSHRRSLGYVFQEASLFPHLTAGGNLNYARKRADTPVTDEFYRQVLDMLGIDTLLKRYPGQLSGGERQRVAIARALLVRPQLLLMDEPLAALDADRKQEIMPYLERLKAQFALPVIYVSHSLDEVARLADHVLVLQRGQLVAQGDVHDVFSRLDVPLPGREVGAILAGQVVERDARWHLLRVACAGGDLWLADGGEAVGQRVRVRIPARDVSLALSCRQDSSILNRLPVTLLDMAADRDPALLLVRLQVPAGDCLLARITRRSADHLQLVAGQALWAQIKSAAIVR